jgi:hypothetical protein
MFIDSPYGVYLPSAILASLLEEFRLRADNAFVHFSLECTTCDGEVRVRTTQPETRSCQQKRFAPLGKARGFCSHVLE